MRPNSSYERPATHSSPRSLQDFAFQPATVNTRLATAQVSTSRSTFNNAVQGAPSKGPKPFMPPPPPPIHRQRNQGSMGTAANPDPESFTLNHPVQAQSTASKQRFQPPSTPIPTKAQPGTFKYAPNMANRSIPATPLVQGSRRFVPVTPLRRNRDGERQESVYTNASSSKSAHATNQMPPPSHPSNPHFRSGNYG